ncbi:hypothetical protein DICVIV_09410 [Dictyocaulus viviparus]|uniref:Uncharacterized protein n=1 Tax=Dictyocaulus viviparus TaxID=29172 RepID=A0A0D8XIS3_DICVI|nr:hypothetical protein DICVIV_09410 [Dictyocaulus viviparus]
MRQSNSFNYKIQFDCKGFGIHDMALINRHHESDGGIFYAKYRYMGDVQVIPAQNIFLNRDLRDDSFSLHNLGVNEAIDVFRILFIKDYDDPFYLRLLENMVQIDDVDTIERTQTAISDTVKTQGSNSQAEREMKMMENLDLFTRDLKEKPKTIAKTTEITIDKKSEIEESNGKKSEHEGMNVDDSTQRSTVEKETKKSTTKSSQRKEGKVTSDTIKTEGTISAEYDR